MRLSIQKLLACLVLFLAFHGAAVANDPTSICLENQTYTPFHYRIRTATGALSEWRVVLPGENVWYGDHAQLAIEIWVDKDRSEKYQILRGNTYSYYRRRPHAGPEFSFCAAPTPKLPGLPGAPASQGNSFAPLEKFVAHCKEQKLVYRLSLKKLAADCVEAEKRGGKLPDDLRYLRGFTWFVGYVVGESDNDVILLGLKDPTRPPLDIDCLATAIKSTYSGAVPRCSLDEHPNPAYQKSVVEGVSWNTLWAEIMIFADYIMKKLCQGHVNPNIKGFRSHQQHFSDVLATRGVEGNGKSSEQGKQRFCNRFWFNFNSQVPRAIGDASGQLVFLHNNPVRVSSEQEVGGAFGSGQTTLSAELFAKDMTLYIDQLGKHYPKIAELQALYRLYDLVRHLREVSQAVPPEMSYWIKQYQHPYQGPPSAMPTLSVKSKVQERIGSGFETQTWTVTGGVSMNIGITRASMQRVVGPIDSAGW